MLCVKVLFVYWKFLEVLLSALKGRAHVLQLTLHTTTIGNQWQKNSRPDGFDWIPFSLNYVVLLKICKRDSSSFISCEQDDAKGRFCCPQANNALPFDFSISRFRYMYYFKT